MTTLPNETPVPPTIPLAPAIRQAYKDLLETYEEQIQNTEDPGLLAALAASQANVDDVLTKDTIYRTHKGTISLQTVLDQINCTNAELVTLKKQIADVASDISMATDILDAIDEVLALVPVA